MDWLLRQLTWRTYAAVAMLSAGTAGRNCPPSVEWSSKLLTRAGTIPRFPRVPLADQSMEDAPTTGWEVCWLGGYGFDYQLDPAVQFSTLPRMFGLIDAQAASPSSILPLLPRSCYRNRH